MAEWLAALETTGFAEALRYSRWPYAAVSAAHILGIALLVGATAPMNLRLLGFFDDIRQTTVTRLLVPFAAAGLGLALASGFLLFSIRAGEYAELGVLRTKLILVAVGALFAIRAHAVHGFTLAEMPAASRRLHGAVSLAAWLGALTCGRLIAFVGN